MSRSFWSAVAAGLLAGLAVVVFAARWYVLGFGLDAPPGASQWRVVLKVRGEIRNPSLTLAVPLDFRSQHVFDETFESTALKPPGREQSVEKVPGQRDVPWRLMDPLQPPVGGKPRSFEITYTFRCVLGTREPTTAMREQTARVDARPEGDRFLRPGPLVQSEDPVITAKAAEFTELPTELDRVEGYYRFVADLRDDPSLDAGDDDPARKSDALSCLREDGGDPLAKARLLVALCRNRGVHARIVTGLLLQPGQTDTLDHWAEAWVNGYWFPMDPARGHFGTASFPANHIVLRVDDPELVRGAANRPRYAFLARDLSPFDDGPDGTKRTPWQKWALQFSFYSLQPAEQQLVRFLLLLPLAALIVAVFRTLIGVRTFGTFSPALLGLAFMDLNALPAGLTIFLGAVFVGWGMRHILDAFRLLLVPRTAILLTLIVVFLIGVTLVGNIFGLRVTHYLALFPLVILTHLVERFWTLEAEDGTVSSFKTLTGTILVSVMISLAMNVPGLPAWMVRYPETVGIVLAVLLLLGRYGGYRLTELYRFRDLIVTPEPPPPAPAEQTPAPVTVAAPEPAVAEAVPPAPVVPEPTQETAG